MTLSKKGISPLIATVLIIGFTIILAAMVFQWGGDLFKQVQEETGAASEAKINCTSGLTNLDVEVETDAVSGDLVVTLDNKNAVDVTGFRVRAYQSDGVVPGDSTAVLVAYGIQTFTLGTAELIMGSATSPAYNPGNVEQVGIFPMITLDNGDIATCESEIKVNVL